MTITTSLVGGGPARTALLGARRSGASLPDLSGHWIQSGTWNNRDSTWFNGMSQFTRDQFASVIFRYHWGEVETGSGLDETSGTFDWTAMDDSADAAEAGSMWFKFVLNWRHFDTTKGDVMPPDLVANYQTTKSGGYISAMHASTVRIRFEKWAKAVIDRYAGYAWFAGIQTTETAGMQTSPGATYNQSTYETELNTLFTNLAAHNSNVWLDIGWNFIAGATTKAESAAAFDNVVAGIASNANVRMFTPDILRADPDNNNEFSSLDKRVYPLFRQSYDGTTTCLINNFQVGSSMQFTSYTLPAANDEKNNGGYDMDQNFTWARDTLDLSFCIWTYQNARNYHFDSPRAGFTYGDAVGVARLPWGHAYDSDYAVAV